MRLLGRRADGRAAGSHADPRGAAEQGAVAIAIGRIRGAPAWIDVSGILDQDERRLARRADEGPRPAAGGGAGLPGSAIVVGFAGPRAAVRSFG